MRIRGTRYTAGMRYESSATVLIIGALHIDETATSVAPIIVGESNPVSWSKTAGGVAANVARAAANSTDFNTVLLANIGAGKDAEALSNALANSDVNVLAIQNAAASTGRYSAILQDTGELLVGLADVEQAQTITLNDVQELIDLASAAAVILDTNLSSASLTEIPREIRKLHEPCLIAAVGVSPSKITRLHDALPYLDILFCNEAEARNLMASYSAESSQDLESISSRLCEKGCKHVVITDGKDKVQIHCKDQHTELNVPRITHPYSVNGPGDALAGASLGALMHESLTHEALVNAVYQHGIPTAAKVVTGEHTAPSLFNK